MSNEKNIYELSPVTKKKFIPVRGSDSAINNMANQPGAVYFATDTRKIYINDPLNEEKKLLMGGNSGIYYSHKDTSTEMNIQENIYFLSDDFYDTDTKGTPNQNDLILNDDGCFYKVKSIDEDRFVTDRVTLAGTGGGSGSGGGGTSSGGRLKILGKNTVQTVRYGDACFLTANVVAQDSSSVVQKDQPISYTISFRKKLGSPYTEILQGEFSGGVFERDISSFLTEGQTTYFQVFFQTNFADGGAAQGTLVFNVRAVSLSIKWLNYKFDQALNLKQAVNLQYNSTGYGPREVHVIINGQDVPSLVTEITGNDTTGVIQIINPEEIGLSHQINTIGLQVIDSGNKNIMTTPDVKKFVFYDEQTTTPIIFVNLDENAILEQYTPVKIPIFYYSPSNNSTTLFCRENGNLVKEIQNVSSGSTYEWDYIPLTATTGSDLCSLSVTNSEQNETHLLVSIKEIDLGSTPKLQNKNDIFTIDAKTFSTKEDLQKWNKNNISMDFSNFDWGINGTGLVEDEDGRAICIKAGSRLRINYNMFSVDHNSNGRIQNGLNFKIIFKTTNCNDYEENFLEYGDSSAKSNCLLMSPIEAKYGSYTHKNSETNEEVTLSQVTVPYCDEKRIEFEFESDKPQLNNGSWFGFSTMWIDGVVSAGYNDIAQITQGQGVEDELVIGSNSCDVYIYLLRIYQNSLTMDEHMANFILDAANGQEMKARFERNDIMDVLHPGNIDPQKLALKNPKCQVHVYEIPRITTSKGDPVSGCTYKRYWAQENNELDNKNKLLPDIETDDKVTIKVQGTSSAKYGAAAFNLDTDFKSATLSGKSTKDNKYCITSSSPGVKYTTTKVNVASCEHANNAINQELYNAGQPFLMSNRRNNQALRDTMEFYPGVVFIKDLNSKVGATLDDNLFSNDNEYANYFKQKNATNLLYPKLYSICNTGNSKKNTEIFHNKNNPLECCIEIADNQDPLQQMIRTHTNDGTSIEEYDKYWKEIVEFRYVKEPSDPDPSKDTAEDIVQREIDQENLEKIKTAWYAFVNWMAKNNPQSKYTAHKNINNQEEFSKEFGNNISENQIYIATITKIHDGLEEQYDYKSVIEYTPNNSIYYTINENQYGYTNELLTIPENQRTFNDFTFSKSGEFLNGITIKKYSSENYNYIPRTKEEAKRKEGSNNIYLQTIENGSISYQQVTTIDNYPNDTEFFERVKFGAYMVDSYEYRMAKMLSECEDHLAMASVIYHYLFIERHTMIDNVAKNTFWSTDGDQQEFNLQNPGHWIWNLVKDYDNDTADGNDNEGRLTRTYGMEIHDQLEDNSYVFNAHESVWLNFIDGIQDVCIEFYNRLKNKNAEKVNEENNAEWLTWSKSEDYCKKIDEWQSYIPERAWNESYKRVYFRTADPTIQNTPHNNNFLLEKFVGGKKTYQRFLYEKYQNIYFDSKYSSNISSDAITVRGGTQDNAKGWKIPFQTAIDCYINAAIGSGNTPNIRERVKKGETYYLTIPYSSLNDATMYFGPASVFSLIGFTEEQKKKITNIDQGLIKDFGNLVPSELSVSATMPKLKQLVVGIDSNIKKDATTNDISSIINNAPVLQTLYLHRFSLNSLNINNKNLLQLISLKNSSITTLILSSNPQLATIILSKNVGSLTLEDLTKLQTLTFEPSTMLNTLNLKSIDTSQNQYSQKILEKFIKLNSLNDKKLTYTLYNSIFNFTPNNNSLSLLDTLKNNQKIYIPNGTRKISDRLTGQAYIDATTLDQTSAYNLYKKYVNAQDFAKLDFIFKNNDNIKIHKISIMADDNLVWEKRNSGQIIASDFFSDNDSPYGAYDETKINKAPTAKTVYNFTKTYKVYDANNNLKLLEPKSLEDIIEQSKTENTILTEDIILVAVFDEQVRKYSIQYKEYEDSTSIIKIGDFDVDTNVLEILNNSDKITLPVGGKNDNYLLNYSEWLDLYNDFKNLDATNAPDLYKYNTCVGFLDIASGGKQTITEDSKVFKDMLITPKFKDVLMGTSEAVNQKYWSIYKLNEENKTAKVSLRNDITQLPEKITVPAKVTIDNTIYTVTNIGTVSTSNQFSDNDPRQKVHYIFVEKDNQISQIDQSAFNSAALLFFDFQACPNLKKIGQQAFNQNYLLDINLLNLNNLTHIEKTAFTNAMQVPSGESRQKDIILHIPYSVSSIDSQAFLNLNHTEDYSAFNVIIGNNQYHSKLIIPTELTPNYSLDGYIGPFYRNSPSRTTITFKIDLYTDQSDLTNQEVQNYFFGVDKWAPTSNINMTISINT